MIIIIIIYLLVRIAAAIIPGWRGPFVAGLQKFSNGLISKKPAYIFEEDFIDVKAFYLSEFGKLPCITFIGNIDAGKVFDLVTSNKFGRVSATYQRNWYN